jgi:hypothetical protein
MYMYVEPGAGIGETEVVLIADLFPVTLSDY